MACRLLPCALLLLALPAQAQEPIPLRVVPAHELILRAPAHLPKLLGFEASHHSLEVVWMAEEGRRIKAGEELARFGFPAELLRKRVDRRLLLARSEALRADAGMAERLQGLAARLALSRIEVKKAELDTKKKNVLSKRDSELVELDARRARFEVRALERQVKAVELLRQAVAAFGSERVRQAQMALADLADLQAAFRIRAPAEGVLRGVKGQQGRRLARGAELGRLVVDGQMQLAVRLTRRQAMGLRPESRVTLRRTGGAKLRKGRVLRLRPLAGGDEVELRIALRKGRVRSGQDWKLLLGEEFCGPVRPGAWERAEARGQLKELYAPECPAQPLLRIAWRLPEGGEVQRGQALLRFDPEPFTRSLRRARDREALAQVRLDKRLAEQGLARFELEMVQTRRELELEKARLLALPGVGLQGALDQERAKLDLQSAELALAQARRAAENFEIRAKAELEVEKLRLEHCLEDLELARRAAEELSLRAPVDGWARCPGLKSGQAVQAGQLLCRIAPNREVN